MSGLFGSRMKFPVHVVQLSLIGLILGLATTRRFLPNKPTGRNGTIALGMAAKSLMIVQYQMATEHIKRFKKYASAKANLILNSLEILFWVAVVYLTTQSQVSQDKCIGANCIIGWVIAGVSIPLAILAVWAAIISWYEWRYFKKNGVLPGARSDGPRDRRSRGSRETDVETVQVQDLSRDGRKPVASSETSQASTARNAMYHNIPPQEAGTVPSPNQAYVQNQGQAYSEQSWGQGGSSSRGHGHERRQSHERHTRR